MPDGEIGIFAALFWIFLKGKWEDMQVKIISNG